MFVLSAKINILMLIKCDVNFLIKNKNYWDNVFFCFGHPQGVKNVFLIKINLSG